VGHICTLLLPPSSYHGHHDKPVVEDDGAQFQPYSLLHHPRSNTLTPKNAEQQKGLGTAATLPPAYAATHSLHGQTPRQYTTTTMCCATSEYRWDKGNTVSATLPLLCPCPRRMVTPYTADIFHTLELSHSCPPTAPHINGATLDQWLFDHSTCNHIDAQPHAH